MGRGIEKAEAGAGSRSFGQHSVFVPFFMPDERSGDQSRRGAESFPAFGAVVRLGPSNGLHSVDGGGAGFFRAAYAAGNLWADCGSGRLAAQGGSGFPYYGGWRR